MLETKAKDQGHKRKRSPKRKKKGLHKNFSGDLQKKEKVFTKIFQGDLHENTFSKKFFKRSTKFFTIQKLVLSSSRGQANFRGLEASRPRPRTSNCVLEDVLEAKDVLEDSTSGFWLSLNFLHYGSLPVLCTDMPDRYENFCTVGISE